MNNINPRWYAMILWYQKKYNLILTSATIILAITSILQTIRIYELEIPNILLIFFIAIIEMALIIIIFESYRKPRF